MQNEQDLAPFKIFAVEDALFDYDDYELLPTDDFRFHKCVLKVKLGENPPGTKFDHIDMIYSSGCMNLIAEQFFETYSIELKVTGFIEKQTF